MMGPTDSLEVVFHAFSGEYDTKRTAIVFVPVIAVALLRGFAVRLTLLGSLRSALEKDDSAIHRIEQGGRLLCRRHLRDQFLSVVAQCGIGECHSFGYRLRRLFCSEWRPR
jgi:hypothetical protein